MFDWIASIFGYVLQWIYEFVGNYGVAIIIFTIITKIILLPLTIKQQKSLELNKKMQPILQDLQERYKNDQQRLATEYQRVMKENKFSPFGGCWVALIQIPLILGMLYVVGKPLTNMIKMPEEQIRAEILEIMPEGETDVDAFIENNRYVELKVIKNKNLLNLDFLGIDLGDVASENPRDFSLLIIPILSAVFTYLSVYVINGKQQVQKMKDADGNEIEMPNMQFMNIMMPFMSGYIAYVVPQGLGLYWLVSSLLQIGIHFIVKNYFLKNDRRLLNE